MAVDIAQILDSAKQKYFRYRTIFCLTHFRKTEVICPSGSFSVIPGRGELASYDAQLRAMTIACSRGNSVRVRASAFCHRTMTGSLRQSEESTP
jgi:hypothetical protein